MASSSRSRRAGHIKGALTAQEVERADVAKRRRRWFRRILPWLCQRRQHLVFADETAVSTKTTRLRGRAVRGRRQLVPTLRPGDVVILDNLSVHKSAAAEAAIRACGARMLFLPKYSPDP